MQPFKAAMLSVREAFYAAFLRSLLRTKSLLQTILNIWIGPRKLAKEPDAHSEGSSTQDGVEVLSQTKRREVADFVEEVARLFRDPTSRQNLVALSDGLKTQFEESLVDNAQCMLPSYQHQLPTGDECGTYLALDVGGSTFRVALIELAGRGSESKVVRRSTIKIDATIKNLQGAAFFDWMAERIEDTISGQSEGHELNSAPLPMGLAWSFPIEQTSLRSGLVLGMGKNFMAAHGLIGQDLGDLIQNACSRKNLNVSLQAIVNDSSACLLASAFTSHTPPTRLSLILGTGCNAAVHLPVSSFSPQKFGIRPSSWHSAATHVIVNTELSMFGGHLLPFTRWDRQLLVKHPRPDFQPLEYFVGGGYLGEIVRLVLIEAIETTGIFGGIVPAGLEEPYSLDTEIVSRIEADTTANLTPSLTLFTNLYPTSYVYTHLDLSTLRHLASHVIHRATAMIATGLYTLYLLRASTSSSIPAKMQIAYNGSVMEQYPGFQELAQHHLELLVGSKGVLTLVPADDSSLLGAAVAVACLDPDEVIKDL
ncbi:phosphotransferase-2 [Coleophoma cylindrospora]|uniref:Phosphotransferase n=1 Tax=Coleophoma cylindrospora TaxID=1849047 RepID=A0A3D8QX50_9HELO|nr:phosphotransferase-2 [Coleophoma cylindrospora]